MSDAKPIRAIIVDDEPLARKGIRSFLKPEPDVEIVGEAADGVEAVKYIQSLSPNVVFLDVQMPGLDGFGVIEKIGVDKMPIVIFVTAYDLHALKAFQVHAIDYLLKPINPESFHHALQRTRILLKSDRSVEINKKLLSLLQSINVHREYQQRFIIKSTGRITVLSVNDLDWIQADGDYVRLYAKGKYHLMRERISNLEQQLDPSHFIRIHRSIIARIDRVKELKPLINGDHLVILMDGTQLSMSRTYRDKVLASLGHT